MSSSSPSPPILLDMPLFPESTGLLLSDITNDVIPVMGGAFFKADVVAESCCEIKMEEGEDL